MAVKIRLARIGSKKSPFYRIIIADSRSPRDGAFIEKVGTYNPLLAKDNNARIVLQKNRIKHWLSLGAQPTDIVAKFIKTAEIGLPLSISKKINIKTKSQTIKSPKKMKKLETN